MRTFAVILGLFVVLSVGACGQAPSAAPPSPAPPTTTSDPTLPASTASATPEHAGQPELRGAIVIDGSSTVFPITEAVAQEFAAVAPNVQVRLGVSGTGGGFKKFCAGDTDISDASRPIKAEEQATCAANKISYIEVPVAFDGISVVVNPENDWAQCMTVAELKQLWEPAAESRVLRWNQIRPSWPDLPVSLYGPGDDSGTHDYFTAAIVGEEGADRSDYTASEDDYVLAQNVSLNRNALGYFGYTYYNEYRDKLNIVAIDNGAGCVVPSAETISRGSYQPLSRPLFIYINTAALERPEVSAFIDLYLANAERLATKVRHVPLPTRAYELAAQRVVQRNTGSVFSGGSQVGVSIEDLLVLEGR